MTGKGENSSAVVCRLCWEAFTVREEEEDEVECNPPRTLFCGHAYCTSCLLSLQCDNVIRCPECEFESTVPESGVYGLQEDCRIIGLIYTAKMNKLKRLHNRRRIKMAASMDRNASAEDTEQKADIQKIERTIDEALAQAAENLAQLKHINESLTGPAEQVKKERTRLVMEINQATDEASHDIQKWRNLQLNQLKKLEAPLCTSQEQVSCVQERIKSLEIAMQMAKQIRRVPFLEQHCTLDKVLRTLQSPVDTQSIDMKPVNLGSGMRCVFQSESLNQTLSLSLKIEYSNPECLTEFPLRDQQPGNSLKKSSWQRTEVSRSTNRASPSRNKLPTPQIQGRKSHAAGNLWSRGSFPTPKPRRWSNLSQRSSPSDLGTPDVIVEEVFNEEDDHAVPSTDPKLANDKLRIPNRGKNQLYSRRDVVQWVVVTHVVNPSHFYVHYLAEKRESDALSKKINQFCCRDDCCFTSSDTFETGSVIFAKRKEGLWCRASVVEVHQSGCVEAVKACPVDQLASIRVFFFDYGPTETVTITSDTGTTESSLKDINLHLRKVTEEVKVEIGHFAPQAIRCSLKDLVPYHLEKGWSEEAQVEFRNVVGSAAVEMWPLGQDRDSLWVDLKKAPMDQSSDVAISVREYLVFIEVARFYSPVTLRRKPLPYYPPVCPQINREVNAVVTHINNPADFYIQLVDNMELVLLSAKLQECCNATTAAEEDNLRVYCPVIGQAYVAHYDDKLWYRAQVTDHPGHRKVEVFYVDFGNKSILSVSDLRKIKDEFFALPSMAIHCCLADVIPLDGSVWSDACTNRFISLADQKLVTVVASGKVQKTEPLPIKMFESDVNGALANIAELLVKEELACFKKILEFKDTTPPGNELWDPPLEFGLTREGVDESNQKVTREQTEELLEFEPVLKLPAKLEELKVKVSHVNSPSSFYVQFAQYDFQHKRVCELVKQECALIEPQDVVWKADMYCAAHINGVWERGKICSDVTSCNIAEVKRCDHGNTVKLHVSNLRPLPSSLMGCFAMECSLTDIRPAGGRSTWTATACDLFSHYLTGASAVVTIKELTDERPVSVTLFGTNKMGQYVSIADFLVSEGLALRERKPRDAAVEKPKETEAQSPVSETQSDGKTSTSPAPTADSLSPLSTIFSTPIPPKPARRTIMSAEKVTTQSYQPPEVPCLGHIQIIVSAIGEDGLIYGRTLNAECQLEQLKERIDQCLKTLPRQKPYTWKSVQGCAVIGPDMLWYRGQLLEVLKGHVTVQYVDYGLVETIPVVHVYPMLLCEDVPQLCMPCCLHNLKPVGDKWQWEAVALLREMLVNRCVDIQVVELPTDKRGPLTVELFLDGLSLSTILCHFEHASVDQTASTEKDHSGMSPACLDYWDIDTEGLKGPEEPMLGPFVSANLPQRGEHFKVRVTHVQTPNEIFLWRLEGSAEVEVDGETLAEALMRVSGSTDSLQQLTNFPPDSPCLAEYSDGKYHRAKLIKFISVEPVMILVRHIDFGSDDTLAPSKLRQMPAELLRFPPQALKVKLAGFKAPSVNTEKDVLPYSPQWSLKAVKEMVELLHSNMTAYVVTQEPELSALLYNEDGELVHLPLVNSGLAEVE